MTTLLHVGPHKTGTTTIQRGFWSRRDALLDQGALYPEAFSNQGAHHPLARAMAQPRSRISRDVIAALSEELSDTGAERLVLSSEAFSKWSAPVAREACREFSRFGEVRPVIVFRRRGDWAFSLFKENVKRGTRLGLLTFGEFCESIRPRLDYDKIVRRWTEAAGTAPIVHSFEALRGSGDLVSSFAASIGLVVDGLESGRMWNVAMDDAATVRVWRLNRAMSRGLNVPPRVRKWLLSASRTPSTARRRAVARFVDVLAVGSPFDRQDAQTVTELNQLPFPEQALS